MPPFLRCKHKIRNIVEGTISLKTFTMPLFGENIKIISREEFVGLTESKRFYTGLVEGIGYVYWEGKTIWFEHVNASNTWAPPIYHQIEMPFIR